MSRFVLLLLFIPTAAMQSQSSLATVPNLTGPTAVISEFLSAGDVQDATRLGEVLHPAYRIVINQFMGGPDVTVLDRATYLGMIKQKKLGGTPRECHYRGVEVNGNIAFVRVSIASKDLSFETMFTLARDTSDRWWLVAEAPYVTSIQP